MIKKLCLFGFLTLAISACVTRLYPNLRELKRIEVVRESEPKANWGALVPINFVGKLKDGSSLSMNKWIEFKDSFISYYPNSIRLHLNFDPNVYQKDSFCIVYKYKLAEYWDSFWIKPTFDAPLYFNYNGSAGVTPQFPKRSFLGLILQGRDGRNGLNGKVGQNGKDVEVRIDKDTSTLLYNIYVTNIATEEVKYYTSIVPVPIIISSNGGRGGNGLAGEAGRTGTTNSRTGIGTNGGNGGNGGDGANGGEGGKIKVLIHPNAKEFNGLLELENVGGAPGKGAAAGRGGRGGGGQVQGIDGLDGLRGMDGFSGFDGPLPEILIDSVYF